MIIVSIETVIAMKCIEGVCINFQRFY